MLFYVHSSSKLQINSLQQLPSRARLSTPALGAVHIEGALTILIHGIVLALGKAILPASIMRDDSAEDGRRVIGADGSDDDTVRTGGLALVVSGFHDGEFEVRLLGVREFEVLVV
jgi:hypothetical protein